MKFRWRIGLILLSLLLLAGCMAQEPPATEATPELATQATTQVPTTEAPTEPPTEAPSLDQDEPLSLLWDEAGEMEDGTAYSYQVPHLNGTGADIDAINAEIEATDGQFVQDILAGGESNCVSIYYSSLYYQNIMALLIYRVYTDNDASYSVYNISTTTGLRVSNEDLLARLNMSTENFDALAKVRAEEVFRDIYGDWYEDDAFFEALAQTCSPKYINRDMPMYIQEGKLFVVSRVFFPDGDGSCELIYPMEKPFKVGE